MADTTWGLKTEPRNWQRSALALWIPQRKGVVSVVTGGGKTIFAFLCMQVFAQDHPDGRFIVIVPTLTLLDQWYVSLQEDFGVSQTDITCYSSEEKPERPGRINLLIINTARSLVKRISSQAPCF